MFSNGGYENMSAAGYLNDLNGVWFAESYEKGFLCIWVYDPKKFELWLKAPYDSFFGLAAPPSPNKFI